MPNEKLSEINEHDAEELIHYPQIESIDVVESDKSKKSGAPACCRAAGPAGCRKAALGPRPAAAWRKKPVRTTPT